MASRIPAGATCDPRLVKRYRALNPDFPHQATCGPFFDEEQFKAYRQLGVHVAEGQFHPAVLDGTRKPGKAPDDRLDHFSAAPIGVWMRR